MTFSNFVASRRRPSFPSNRSIHHQRGRPHAHSRCNDNAITQTQFEAVWTQIRPSRSTNASGSSSQETRNYRTGSLSGLLTKDDPIPKPLITSQLHIRLTVKRNLVVGFAYRSPEPAPWKEIKLSMINSCCQASYALCGHHQVVVAGVMLKDR